VIDGKFKGLTGRVARYQGQQRVAIIIDGAFTMATAYLPTAFLEYI
jgi:ribosomal protein L24